MTKTTAATRRTRAVKTLPRFYIPFDSWANAPTSGLMFAGPFPSFLAAKTEIDRALNANGSYAKDQRNVTTHIHFAYRMHQIVGHPDAVRMGLVEKPEAHIADNLYPHVPIDVLDFTLMRDDLNNIWGINDTDAEF